MAKPQATEATKVRHTATFVQKRDTKGAVVFQETNDKFPTLDKAVDAEMDEFVVGSLYLRKKALNGAEPKTVKVTIEY